MHVSMTYTAFVPIFRTVTFLETFLCVTLISIAESCYYGWYKGHLLCNTKCQSTQFAWEKSE